MSDRYQIGEIEAAGAVVPSGQLWRPVQGFEWSNTPRPVSRLEGQNVVVPDRPDIPPTVPPAELGAFGPVSELHGPWLIARGVTFGQDVLRPFTGPPDKPTIERIPPRSAHAALSDFSALPDQGEKLQRAVLAFAGRYGWLGAPVQVQDGAQFLMAESLALWKQELATIRGVVELTRRTKALFESRAEKDRLALRELISEFKAVPPSIPGTPDDPQITEQIATLERLIGPAPKRPRQQVRRATVDVGGTSIHIPVGPSSIDNPTLLLDVARRAVSSTIERKLTGAVAVRLKLPPEGRVNFEPTSLLAAMYLDLASAVVGGGTGWRICRGCGRAFVPRDRRQLFHKKSCQVRDWRSRKANKTEDVDL